MTNKQLDYFDLYEKLYQTGYHTDMSLSHTKKLYPHLHEVTPTDKEKLKILDVGCSNGHNNIFRYSRTCSTNRC